MSDTSPNRLQMAGDSSPDIEAGRTTVDSALNDLETKFHQVLIRELDGPHTHWPRRDLAGASRISLTGEPGVEDPRTRRLPSDSEWKGILSDWTALEAIVNWDRECCEAKLAWDHRLHLSRLNSTDQLLPPLRLISAHFKSVSDRLQALFKTVDFDVAEISGQPSHLRLAICDLLSRLKRWQGAPEGLSKWIGYQVRRARLNDSGLTALMAALHEGHLRADAANDQLRVCYYQAVIREAFRRNKGLSEFDGQSYEQWIEEFRALDERRIMMARGEVAIAHYDAIPRSSGGEIAVVRREIEKKRKHKPIRQLIKDAGTAILAIKPVFMMSPLSVKLSTWSRGSVEALTCSSLTRPAKLCPVDAARRLWLARRRSLSSGTINNFPPRDFLARCWTKTIWRETPMAT